MFPRKRKRKITSRGCLLRAVDRGPLKDITARETGNKHCKSFETAFDSEPIRLVSFQRRQNRLIALIVWISCWPVQPGLMHRNTDVILIITKSQSWQFCSDSVFPPLISKRAVVSAVLSPSAAERNRFVVHHQVIRPDRSWPPSERRLATSTAAAVATSPRERRCVCAECVFSAIFAQCTWRDSFFYTLYRSFVIL